MTITAVDTCRLTEDEADADQWSAGDYPDADQESASDDAGEDIGDETGTDGPMMLSIAIPEVITDLPVSALLTTDLLPLGIPERIAALAHRRAVVEQYARRITDYIGLLMDHPSWGEMTQQEIADRLSELGYQIGADAVGKQRRAAKKRKAGGCVPTVTPEPAAPVVVEATAGQADDDGTPTTGRPDQWSDAT